MNPSRPQKNHSSRLKRYLFFGVLVLIAVAGMEGAIRLTINLVPNNPLMPIELFIPDSRLGERLNPKYPGHDKNGFRNSGTPGQADLVVLGDSQTYGHGVPVDRLWPQQVGDLTGLRAYNMSVPGYGPVQSLFLLDRALDLGPTVVVEAFYSGNDLYDAYRMAYYLNDLTELKSTEPQEISSIKEWEARKPLSTLINEVYDYREKTVAPGPLARAKLWLDSHIMVYRLLRTLRDRAISSPEGEGEVKQSDPLADARRYPEDLLAAGPGAPSTIFTPRYRFAAINLEDPRIREGLQVSLRAIERMNRRVVEKGGCFAVVMIPTKEFVYGDMGDDPASRAPARANFLRLLEHEQAMWKHFRDYLAQRGISYVDAGPALSHRVRQGEAMYPLSTDGHPMAAGHDIIAQSVANSGVCGLRARTNTTTGAESGKKL